MAPNITLKQWNISSQGVARLPKNYVCYLQNFSERMLIRGCYQGCESHNSLSEQRWATINKKPENVVHIMSFLAFLLFRVKSFYVLQICMSTHIQLLTLTTKWNEEGRGGELTKMLFVAVFNGGIRLTSTWI